MNKLGNEKQAKNQSVVRQIDDLNRMSAADLQKRWNDLFGTDPGRVGRQYLIRRLAYRIQELIHGGLSREAKQQLQRLAKNPDAVKKIKSKTKNLQVGSRFLRNWQGENHEVIVAQEGFTYDGKTYRSLSAVARAITGTHRNGRRFFGLKPNSKTTGKNGGKK